MNTKTSDTRKTEKLACLAHCQGHHVIGGIELLESCFHIHPTRQQHCQSVRIQALAAFHVDLLENMDADTYYDWAII